ncbi:DUF4062 domain-containing protein [Massilia sp. W12]|uniref:DUF4062 domain-containing protein n=1 Tax=Massilia sp. W12 TaxID=3126507 RepID=UPI0030D2AEEB
MNTSIKYQIFVSSTYRDLKDERDQVIKGILELGHIPIGMEMFSAADEDQWQVIAKKIDEADYYVLILAHRYGTTTSEGLSYTEKEYDYAISQHVPILGFIIDDEAHWPANKMDKDATAQQRLFSFKEKVLKRLIKHWTDKHDLHAKVCAALVKSFSSNPRTGWIRASEAPAIQGSYESEQFGASSRLRIDIYYYSNKSNTPFSKDHANALASQYLRLGMSPRVLQHVQGNPDAFFIGALVTAAELRAVLTSFDTKTLKYLFPPDSPDSEAERVKVVVAKNRLSNHALVQL